MAKERVAWTTLSIPGVPSPVEFSKQVDCYDGQRTKVKPPMPSVDRGRGDETSVGVKLSRSPNTEGRAL